jgi:flagellar motility protein MotE (MotC chaperone)
LHFILLLHNVTAEVKTLSLRLTETEAFLSDSQAKNASLESELYTRTAALEACTADSLLAAQELDGLRKQLANLHEALRQLQWRSERDLKTFHDTAGKERGS